jgi:uncharacterized protein with NRDE domain
MCSIILHIGVDGVFIAANRDEMLARPWDPPAEYWPGICGGRDRSGGGTWAAINRHKVFAALLNREGTLGPAIGKISRGNLPLLALAYDSAARAAAALERLDATNYRSFNLIIADAMGAFLLQGFEAGRPKAHMLPSGVTMLTSGEPNDTSSSRIARHLPRFQATNPEDWKDLMADSSGTSEEQLNVTSAANGFGTVCSTFIHLPRHGVETHQFAAGRPDQSPFLPVALF